MTVYPVSLVSFENVFTETHQFFVAFPFSNFVQADKHPLSCLRLIHLLLHEVVLCTQRLTITNFRLATQIAGFDVINMQCHAVSFTTSAFNTRVVITLQNLPSLFRGEIF